MKNLSVHRLKSVSEIMALIETIGLKKFNSYLNTVYTLMQGLLPGDVFKIEEKVRRENQGVFIKVVCLYILETKGECNVELSNDWDSVIGIQTMNSYLLELSYINHRRNAIMNRNDEKGE